jgi:hypothetical protein
VLLSPLNRDRPLSADVRSDHYLRGLITTNQERSVISANRPLMGSFPVNAPVVAHQVNHMPDGPSGHFSGKKICNTAALHPATCPAVNGCLPVTAITHPRIRFWVGIGGDLPDAGIAAMPEKTTKPATTMPNRAERDFPITPHFLLSFSAEGDR